MMNELINSLKVQLHERVSNPVVGTFALSWVVFNYEFLIVFFSRTSLDLKLFVLRQGLYSGLIEHFSYWVIAPLISSIFIILIYPLISFKLYEYWYKSQKKLKEIRQSIEDETPLTNAESRIIRDKFISLQLNYEDERQILHDKISLLKSDRDKALSDLSKSGEMNASARRDNNSLQEEIKKIQHKYDPNKQSQKAVNNVAEGNKVVKKTRFKLLELLSENPAGISRDMLDAQLPNNSRLSVALHELAQMHFIVKDNNLEIYKLLDKGRDYFIDLKIAERLDRN